jgi:hypothetical protein
MENVHAQQPKPAAVCQGHSQWVDQQMRNPSFVVVHHQWPVLVVCRNALHQAEHLQAPHKPPTAATEAVNPTKAGLLLLVTQQMNSANTFDDTLPRNRTCSGLSLPSVVTRSIKLSTSKPPTTCSNHGQHNHTRHGQKSSDPFGSLWFMVEPCITGCT